MASGGLSDQSMDYGLPPRPPTASTAVWKHLLRTTTTTEAPKSLKDTPIIAPPMAPLDKNATSMRVLLHDTQANFERFTTQVGKLFETIQESKNELKTMQALFQRDRETLTGDMVDLVNRSQKEIQKSIGTPTQSDAFENLCKNVNHRLDGLDQRLEAMNAFNQTHSQVLQTQMQTVQLILDKQGSILSAVTPLLPFLQGFPPLIEALRTVITEKMQELSTSLESHPRRDASPIATNKRKRTFDERDTTSVSSCDNAIKSPGLSRKKSRLMDLSAEAQSSSDGTLRVTEGTSTLASSSSPLRPASLKTFSGTTASIQPQEHQSSTTHNLTTPRRHVVNFAVPAFPPPSNSRRRLNTFDLTTSSAEHGSSSAISSAPLSSVPPGFFAIRSHTSVPTNMTAPTSQGQPRLFGLTPTAARPPRMLRVHASLAARSRSNSVVSVPGSHAAPEKGPDFIDDKKDHPKPSQNGEQNRAAQSGTSVSTTTEPTSVIGRITRSNTRALAALASPSIKASDAKKRPPQPSIQDEKEAFAHDVKNVLMVKHPPDAKLNTVRPVPGRWKERRSPVKEGRRFIPLIDSEDDEENQ